MSRAVAQSIDEEAVAHAHLAEHSGELMWTHIGAEYTQDVFQIAATLATDAPLAWTLANDFTDDGAVRFLTGTTVDEIRGQYEQLRKQIEIHRWRATLEIRQGWYTVSQGVCTAKHVPTGTFNESETVTLFPVGNDGILGEIQVGIVGHRPDGGVPSDNGSLPETRLAALAFHDAYMDALRTEDVEHIVAAHSPKVTTAIRNYLTDDSNLLTTNGPAELAAYFTSLFERYRVVDVQLVNRVAETWYVFAELHWTVEERTGEGRTLEFCTAELSPFGSDGHYLVRTGSGTHPVEV
jgi:predicted SnoaL-like aldol condensation-catalyzing enzyme